MKKQNRVLVWLCPVLFLIIFLLGVRSGEAQTMGKTVDMSNYQEYQALLSMAQLYAVKAAKNFHWTFPTGNLRFPFRHTDRFLSASEKNAGKFDVDEKGLLIEKATGKYPEYNVYGFPFPQIDPKDPKAGVKVMWNHNFQKYRFMGSTLYYTIRWVDQTGGQDRYFAGLSSSISYQGRPPGHELKNPRKLLYQDFGQIKEPMDLKNTNYLSWEYWDERDTVVFNYVPVIRRVRQTSGAARSDPYMGSDSWQDGKDNWGGKNQSFTWKLLGERTILVPFHSLDKQVFEEEPDGTMGWTGSAIVKFGYETPGWKGAPWAITNSIWVPRPVWVIEGMPKDPYYAHGKHTFHIDKEIYYNSNAEVYDKAGVFSFWHVTPTIFGEGPSGNNGAGRLIGMSALDVRTPHATVNPLKWDRFFMPVSRLGPDYMSMSTFMQLSK